MVTQAYSDGLIMAIRGVGEKTIDILSTILECSEDSLKADLAFAERAAHFSIKWGTLDEGQRISLARQIVNQGLWDGKSSEVSRAATAFSNRIIRATAGKEKQPSKVTVEDLRKGLELLAEQCREPDTPVKGDVGLTDLMPWLKDNE